MKPKRGYGHKQEPRGDGRVPDDVHYNAYFSATRPTSGHSKRSQAAANELRANQ